MTDIEELLANWRLAIEDAEPGADDARQAIVDAFTELQRDRDRIDWMGSKERHRMPLPCPAGWLLDDGTKVANLRDALDAAMGVRDV